MADEKSAQVSWKGERLDFAGELGSGYEVVFSADSDSEGASPMEMLLAGVAGCTAMDVVNVLRKMRQPLSGLTVEIHGWRAEEHPKVYTMVKLLYVVQGEAVDPAAIERAIRLSQESYCSASVIFRRAGVEIETDYRIEAAA